MEFNLKTGTTGKQEIIVKPEDTAIYYGSGSVEVYATPAMIALMEKTAHLSIREQLPAGYITLGTEICVTHVKATTVGTKVHCESELRETEGKRLLFSVKVYDAKGLIGQGTHRRYIVEAESFMQKLTEIS